MPSTTSIYGLWKNIERVLERNAPDTAATLAPPATEEQISALEVAIGQVLPSELRASLRVHDGQRDPTRCHAFCGNGMLLGTVEIAEHWRMVTEIDSDTRAGAAPGLGPWWKISCIPFTDADGDMLCIDTDRSLGSRAGEVVCHVHDSEIERGHGANYEAWLWSLARRLEAGQFRIDNYGYLRVDTKAPPV